MVYIGTGLSSESRAELVEFCMESAEFYGIHMSVNFAALSDEDLLDYAEEFEQMDYKRMRGF